MAVVSDGTAVLGLGDIGPEAAMPVMEGKAMLFKEFGGVDAFPICLDTKDPDEIVRIVQGARAGLRRRSTSRTSPRRAASRSRSGCKRRLDIPVFHDDQHGTAVVVLAALLNALKIVKKRLEDMKIVVGGVGRRRRGVHARSCMNAGARNDHRRATASGAIYRAASRT